MIRSSETSDIKTQTPGNYPKRNILQLKHGESLKTRRLLSLILSITAATRPEYNNGSRAQVKCDGT